MAEDETGLSTSVHAPGRHDGRSDVNEGQQLKGLKPPQALSKSPWLASAKYPLREDISCRDLVA
jgi:hypothetical protein